MNACYRLTGVKVPESAPPHPVLARLTVRSDLTLTSARDLSAPKVLKYFSMNPSCSLRTEQDKTGGAQTQDEFKTFFTKCRRASARETAERAEN